MYKGYSLLSSVRTSVAAVLIAMCAFAAGLDAQQLVPQSPRLSLTGGEGGYNNSWYPDGRLWVAAAGNSGVTEVMVPVFMKNCWQTRSPYTVQPIYSFNFKLQYDSTALKPIGVVSRGPFMNGTHPNVRIQAPDSAALTEGWQLTWDDAVDSTYQVQNGLISPNNPNRLRGKRVRIAGQSSRPLPTTGSSNDCNQYEYRPLLYVKFQVLGRPGLGVSDVSPLIITTDSIYYNNSNVYRESPFPGDANYPQPQPLDRIIAGVDYTRIGIEPAAVNTINKGMIYVHVHNRPQFAFLPEPTGNPNEVSVRQETDSLFSLTRVIPFDPVLQQAAGQAVNEVQVYLKPDGVRATNIIVESDQPWLLFQTRGAKNPIQAPSRVGRIAYIDKGILGSGGLGFPDVQNANFPSAIDPLMNFRIICDPGQLTDNPDPKNPSEFAGKYVGYITFRSANADFTPVRLRVEFLVVRSPDETYNGVPSDDKLAKGMWINVRNSGTSPRSADLMFGTGLRATKSVDSLFGEFAQQSLDSSNFFARFFQLGSARDTSAQDVQAQTFGFGDVTGIFSSRDIRSVNEDTTLVYRCRFSAGGALNYPVILTWDKNQFPEGSQLYIRDILNGTLFGVNMREATPVPGGNGSLLAYTIRDSKITAFDIEYTPARARIQQKYNAGWNLVSLPVRPSLSDYKVIWPNAPSSPIKYSISYYQPETDPSVGYGYFLRFPNPDTTIISGLLVKRIASDVYPVRLYEGWNTIGSLSVPVGVDRISYDPAATGLTPPSALSGIYGYSTDRGYREVSEIKPGMGYWVKLSGQGYYNVVAPVTKSSAPEVGNEEVKSVSARITLRDAAERENTLFATEGRVQVSGDRFELPPVPPSVDLFDVRFSNNGYVTSTENPIVRFSGVDYPVTINVSNSTNGYTVVDAQTGIVVGEIAKGNGRVVVSDERITSLRLLSNKNTSSDYSFDAVPNPVSTKSTVSFAVPETQVVTIGLFNAMGQQIRTLVNGVVTKGESTVELDASDLATGTYLVKIVANDFVSTKKINVIR